MIHRSSLCVFMCVLLCAGVIACAEQTRAIRVACVGDSITYGAFIPDRERACYPAALQRLLGKGYEVRNFGLNGATLLSDGDLPYVKQNIYQDALAYGPDVVLIKLGTNDTKQFNWLHADKFVDDYTDLIDSFRTLRSGPRVILCLPVPAWTESDSIDGGRVRVGVLPRIRNAAYATRSELIDLHTPLRDQQEWFPDGVHPDTSGAEWIAKRVHEVLTSVLDDSYNITAELPDDAEVFDFHGYVGMRFRHEGVEAMVVKPYAVASGRPWVWRARFWGHEPQTDLAMLERGWHITYCDVSNLYGSPEAVQRWNRFYERMRTVGLGDDLVLEGMSRGGLIIYNWAKANADKVSAIYGDAPVCDIRSWPGGLGTSSGSEQDWLQAKTAYGLAEDDINTFTGNPIDGLEALANAGVPLLHVVGDADDAVPVLENSAILEERYKGLGGDIAVIHKPGIGHHPHSLDNPEPIVEFFLNATGRP